MLLTNRDTHVYYFSKYMSSDFNKCEINLHLIDNQLEVKPKLNVTCSRKVSFASCRLHIIASSIDLTSGFVKAVLRRN